MEHLCPDRSSRSLGSHQMNLSGNMIEMYLPGQEAQTQCILPSMYYPENLCAYQKPLRVLLSLMVFKQENCHPFTHSLRFWGDALRVEVLFYLLAKAECSLLQKTPTAAYWPNALENRHSIFLNGICTYIARIGFFIWTTNMYRTLYLPFQH